MGRDRLWPMPVKLAGEKIGTWVREPFVEEGDGAQAVMHPEFPGYFSEATRDWQRAIDGYLKLRKKRL